MNAPSPQQPASMTVDQAIKQAVEHHQAGQLQDAERMYRAIIQAQPQHPDANHNLGVLAVQVGKPEMGLPYFKAAMESNPAQDQYWISYVDALVKAGHHSSARDILAQAKRNGLHRQLVANLAERLNISGQIEQYYNSRAVHRNKPRTLRTLKLKQPATHKSARTYESNQLIGQPELDSILLMLNNGSYVEAELIVRKITERFPHDGIGWKILGTVYIQLNRFVDAHDSLTRASTLLLNDFELQNNLGHTLTKLGRLVEALAHFQRALDINPEFAEAHNNLATALQSLGRLKEAESSYRRSVKLKPELSEAHRNLGALLQRIGKLEEAEISYQLFLESEPDFFEIHITLVDIYQQLGQLEKAEASYRRALEIKPDFAELHNNLGNFLQDQCRFEEAEKTYRRALKIKPNFAEAYNNLGALLQAQGRLEEAEKAYRRALEIKPDFARVHSNLGNILSGIGKLDEAEASYRYALAIDPNFFEAYINLGYALKSLGKIEEALASCVMSMNINETQLSRRLFAECVSVVRFKHHDNRIRSLMVRAISEPWCRPSDLMEAAVSLIKLTPSITECIMRSTDAWPLRLTKTSLFTPLSIEILSSDYLLHYILTTAPIGNYDFEKFLTMVRYILLITATEAASNDDVDTLLSLYCALAQQCFLNEYVFDCTPDETDQACMLKESLIAALKTDTKELPILWIVAVSAYFPLHSLPFCELLLDRSWPEVINSLLNLQIIEHHDCISYKSTITQLTPIIGSISHLVKCQYEEHPYPRWHTSSPPYTPLRLNEYFISNYPFAQFQKITRDNCVDILVAGCGTGQHAIETAMQYTGAQVLAIDLSISSICYAKLKTIAIGLNNVEYAQADIMELGQLDRTFDVIESVGVLHHLADPMAGWRILLSLLRPQGFMRIGLYSEIARKGIIRAQIFASQNNYDTTSGGIRICRRELMMSDHEEFSLISELRDFYSISGCRDLLFHAHERRMTLEDINLFLNENNLEFVGFTIDRKVLHDYRQMFPNDPAATNILQWSIFEHKYPLTFRSMYQFWIQKRS